jgi:uroporphyrin-III C-methyltransferase/precorrin-2 dehydrogenase/sirohydrochlorin ferrochelatase
MKSFPIFINLIHKPVLVVGGGDVALRKIDMLLKADAKITVIASKLCNELKHYEKLKKIQVRLKSFEKNDLTHSVLVVAATDNKKVNSLVSKTAQALNIPVNVVDEPALCTFTMGSIIDRSPLLIAISSEGNAPVLAKFVREKIEALIPHNFSKLASIMGSMRDSIKGRYETTQSRRIFWENFIDHPLVRQFLNQTKKMSAQQLTALVKKNGIQKKQGEVFLVGGGPGDPDLLTFRALHLMQRSDVCVYDNLVSKDVLNLVRRDAELS